MSEPDELAEVGQAIAELELRRHDLILSEHAQGQSLREIASRAGVSHQTVANIIKRAKG